ncbi:hypothetical protein SLEP1_g13063 [Rubroshorea leprosula]|uniref:Uncharacterized protein n=1 Tax=Rubroshorea leprosula TaxID=152421 RepID=A0AAV5IQ53_9ROSI|nr:hypothetical protein SLEP1_g13063 [Rubroshorea leprosula]
MAGLVETQPCWSREPSSWVSTNPATGFRRTQQGWVQVTSKAGFDGTQQIWVSSNPAT